ncbi:MAG: NnrS family protein [SAR324 cluster bacterium]|nr:NnrS family protein [SAR324 cluster bacterium]
MTGTDQKTSPRKYAFLNLGFRPFFLGAASFAFLSILLWMGIYIGFCDLQFSHFAPVTWHAHEMIFGYCIAVIAGFLLTAVKNWTEVQTLHGYPLLGLFLCWLAARVLPFFGSLVPLESVAFFDIMFLFLLILSLAFPICKSGNWRNLGIVGILLLLLGSNIVFYLGILGILQTGTHDGLYSGFYLILALVFIMGRRVIPLFIARGVDSPVELLNWKWLDISILPLFLIYWLTELTAPFSNFSAGLAGSLFLLHGIRLAGWHTLGIWKKPLLWILFLGYAMITLGFALKTLSVLYGFSPFLAVHAFGFGGIGMISFGMMARVSLGHTGRNVFDPPRSLFPIFALLLFAALIRIIFPMLDPTLYRLWIILSQLFWLSAFGAFLFIFFPILIHPRIDGTYG